VHSSRAETHSILLPGFKGDPSLGRIRLDDPNCLLLSPFFLGFELLLEYYADAQSALVYAISRFI